MHPVASGAQIHAGTQRILFVRLPSFVGFQTHHPHDVTLPLPIAYMATMAQQSGREARVIDVWARNQPLGEVVEQIRAATPEVVFFEADAPAFPVVQKCAEAVRSFSDARLVAYGSVPTFMPERVVGEGLPFAVAIHGEPEFSALELLDAFDGRRPLAEVEGIAFWDDELSMLQKTPLRREPDDLDLLPIPNYELFDLDLYRKYSFPMPIHRRVRWGHVLATRGCPYPCSHCSFDHRQTFGRRMRKHSPKRFVDNLEVLASRYGVNAVSIEDDIFTIDRKYVVEVCEEIEERGLDLKWVVQTRVDCYDRPLLQRMKRAGCVGLSLGIESGNDRVLKKLKKGFTRAQALEGIRIAQEEGFMLRLLFMIGNPSETAAEIEDTIDLVCRAQAITVQCHIATPYPGTGLLGEDGADTAQITDFSSYDRIVRNLGNLPDEQLWQLQKKFYRRYFFSWRYLKLFLRQRLRYLDGSWRDDLPLIFNAFWYLVWASRRQATRDVAGMFDGERSAPATRPQLANAAGPAGRDARL